MGQLGKTDKQAKDNSYTYSSDGKAEGQADAGKQKAEILMKNLYVDFHCYLVPRSLSSLSCRDLGSIVLSRPNQSNTYTTSNPCHVYRSMV